MIILIKNIIVFAVIFVAGYIILKRAERANNK